MILSHHRSGSNFLNDLIQTAGIECINEPLSMHTDFRRYDLELWTGDEFAPTCLHERLSSTPGTSAFIRVLCDWLLLSPPAATRGIKETLLFDKLSWYHALMPSLKVIWLIRDPRAVIHSILHSGLWRLWEYQQRVAPFCQEYFGDRSIAPASPGELALWSWLVRQALATEHLTLFAYIKVRLEDLVRSPEAELERISRFLGVAVRPQQGRELMHGHESRGGAFSTVRDSDKVLTGWEQGLTSELRRYIEDVAGEEMASLGYL
jgi:Sulfotransferase family